MAIVAIFDLKKVNKAEKVKEGKSESQSISVLKF